MTTDNKTLPVFRFARYVNGIRMAEGVTIEKAQNLPEAMRTAAKLATIGHGGDVPVLVHEPSSLADAQPGGRVRLGGAPWPEIDVILADAYSAGAEGLPFEGIARRAAVRKAIAALSAQPLAAEVNCLREALRRHDEGRTTLQSLASSVGDFLRVSAALSAQPSPGGQSDVPLRVFSAGRWTYDGTGQTFSHEDMDAVAFVVYRDAFAARQPVGEPVEMSPEFTDTARAAIAWVLWHHQGGSSPVGQPLRFALGMGQHDRMTDHQIAEAKRFAAWAGATTEGFHRRDPAQAVDLAPVRDVFRRWHENELNSTDAMLALVEALAVIDSQAVGK